MSTESNPFAEFAKTGKLPPHLQELVRKLEQDQPRFTVTDRTPAGYGPGEEA